MIKTLAVISAMFGMCATSLTTAELVNPLPVIQVKAPLASAIYQRNSKNLAEISVECKVPNGFGPVLCQVVVQKGGQSVADWVLLKDAGTPTQRSTKLQLSSGWYKLEFRGQAADKSSHQALVEPFGVGEVFIICGQSNSANYGGPKQKPADARISSCDWATGKWGRADDPQPGASGSGGSAWPKLGDLMAGKYDLPVGFISLGVGSTSVGQWAVEGNLYPRITKALALTKPNGVRAILWHQGESDSLAGTTTEVYAKTLTAMIEKSRQDAGFELPWGIAVASWHPDKTATVEKQAQVVAAQHLVVKNVPQVFQGPCTDSYHLKGMLLDSVHFNEKGLSAHAEGWLMALAPLLKQSSGK